MTSDAPGYRALLRLLPRSFRDEFDDEMTLVFLEQHHRSRGAGRLWLWIETIAAIVGLSVRLRLDQTRIDLRHAVRGLLRQKTFTLTAVTTLALALGPATAVFSVLQSVVLDPLPGANLERVVYAWITNPERNRREFPWSELNFLDHRERTRQLSSLAAFTATSATFGGETPQQVIGAWVSPDIFDRAGHRAGARPRLRRGRYAAGSVTGHHPAGTNLRPRDSAPPIRLAVP